MPFHVKLTNIKTRAIVLGRVGAVINRTHLQIDSFITAKFLLDLRQTLIAFTVSESSNTLAQTEVRTTYIRSKCAFCFNFLTRALVTQTVVGNQEKKMLCYKVAIDNFPPLSPQIFLIPPADDSRFLALREFYLIL